MRQRLKWVLAAAGILLAVAMPALGSTPEADVITAKGNPEPDTSLRDTENVPLGMDIDEYMSEEVLPQPAPLVQHFTGCFVEWSRQRVLVVPRP